MLTGLHSLGGDMGLCFRDSCVSSDVNGGLVKEVFALANKDKSLIRCFNIVCCTFVLLYVEPIIQRARGTQFYVTANLYGVRLRITNIDNTVKLGTHSHWLFKTTIVDASVENSFFFVGASKQI